MIKLYMCMFYARLSTHLTTYFLYCFNRLIIEKISMYIEREKNDNQATKRHIEDWNRKIVRYFRWNDESAFETY